METNSRNRVAITLLPNPGDEVTNIFESEVEFEIWKLLRTKFPLSAKLPAWQFEIFYKLHLATFIDLDTHPFADKEFILNTVVTFLVCKRGRNGARHVPVLVIYSESDPFASDIQSTLKITNVAVLTYKSSASIDSFAEAVNLALEKPSFLKGILKFTKTLVNKSEFNLRVLVKDALYLYLPPETRKRLDSEQYQHYMKRIKNAKDSVDVFQEVAVCEVIQQKHTQRVQLERYRQRARFDLLVTTAPPYARPRLALEFDGPDHETAKGKRTDALKNELCIAAGLPLVRVHFRKWITDSVIVPGDEGNLFHEELANSLYKRFVGTVVRQIGDEIVFPIEQTEKYREEKLAAVELEKKIARELEAKLGEKYASLDFKARYALIQEALIDSGIDPYEYHAEMDINATYLSPQSWWPHSYIGTLLQEVIDARNGIVKDAKVLYQEGGWSGGLQLILPDQKGSKTISTPRLEFSAFGVPDEWMKNMIKSFLASWLLESAISILNARQATVD